MKTIIYQSNNAVNTCSVGSGQHEENKQPQCGVFNPSEKHWCSCHLIWSTAVIRLWVSLTCIKEKKKKWWWVPELHRGQTKFKGTTESVCKNERVLKDLQALRGPLTAAPPTEELGFVGSGWPLLLPLLVRQPLSSFLCGTGLNRQVLPVT